MNFTVIIGIILKLCQLLLGKEFATMTREFRELMTTIKKARDNASEQGRTITLNERKELLTAISEFHDSLTAFAKSIGK